MKHLHSLGVLFWFLEDFVLLCGIWIGLDWTLDLILGLLMVH
jgi:hypothetical protein